MSRRQERAKAKVAALKQKSEKVNEARAEQDRRAADPHYTFAGPRKGWVLKPKRPV